MGRESLLELLEPAGLISTLAAMEAHLKNFWELGYTIFPRLVKDPVVKQAQDAVPRLQYVPIFKAVFGDYDNSRMQAELPTPMSPAFASIADTISSKIFNRARRMRWKPAEWVALKSLPGGDEQEAHHDFPSFEIARARAKYDSIQAGLIVGLMPKTKLVVYESCFTQSDLSKRRVLEFGPGDCVLFRGDLVHAGAAFQELNYRMHLTVTVRGIKWAANATEAAPHIVFKCQFCHEKYGLRVKLRNHTRYCINNPERGRHAAKMKSANETGRTCDQCNKFFEKTNSYYKHRKRWHSAKARYVQIDS